MPGTLLASRVPQHTVKAITFDAVSWGQLAASPMPTLFTIIGSVLIQAIFGRVTTTLVSAGGGTIALGTTNNATGLITTTTATTLTTTANIWIDGTARTEVHAALVDKIVTKNLLLTTATADITAGAISFEVWWLPMSFNGKLS